MYTLYGTQGTGSCMIEIALQRLFSASDVPNALGIMAAAVSRWAGARSALQQSRPEFVLSLVQVDIDPNVAPVFARHWPQWTG